MHLIPWIHSRGSETISTVRDACEATKWQLEMQHLAFASQTKQHLCKYRGGQKAQWPVMTPPHPPPPPPPINQLYHILVQLGNRILDQIFIMHSKSLHWAMKTK
jgi:hypothetical protein